MMSIDEQIAYQREPWGSGDHEAAILATLQSIKDAGDDVVEPLELATVRADIDGGYKAHWKPIVDYIDTLLSAYKRACVERDEALANHKAAEENVSDLMAEAFAVTPVAGGHAVRAAEDSLSAAGESPAFTKWCRERYGDVRPIFWPVLLDAFNTGAKKGESEREQFRKDAERLLDTLEWLDSIGGLGIEVHRRIRAAIDSARNK